jgi:hypothetical protein
MKQYLRIVLKQEPKLFYDWELPDGWSLQQCIAQIMMSGYFLTPKFFVPYESIAHMCVIEVKDGDVVDFTKARMQ